MFQIQKKRKGKYYTINRVNLIHSGKEYFTLLEKMIDEAQHSVQFQTYIFNNDETGSAVLAALIRAAQRGIVVYLMVDGYASQQLSGSLIQKLEQSGIKFRFYEPILRGQYFYFGRRLHHKVVVVDARLALVGGINIANRYNDVKDQRAWMDLAVLLEGEAAIELYEYCYALWTKEKSAHSLPQYHEKLLQLIPNNQRSSVRVRRNDWVKGKREIWKTYFCLFNNATESITVMCSYFLPGQELRKALNNAVKRGVKVKVVLAGPSDIVLAKYAERYLYNWMLRHDIEIFEYQPTVLHAKIAVVDSHWVTIGSYNINNISAYASIELNLDIRNKPFAYNVQMELDEVIAKDCIRIRPESYKVNFPFIKIFLQRLSYDIIRLILYLFTFYFKKEE